jgi:hypothetical protein
MVSLERSFDVDTQRHWAAPRAGERTRRDAMLLLAGQLRRWLARAARAVLVITVLAASCESVLAAGAPGKVVFYLDTNHRPVVRLDRVPLSEGVKAILAMYALQNGAGCEGKNEQALVKCALTSELGLGANCSEEHVRLVRAWFAKTPNLTGRWDERWNRDARKAGSLENLCYGQPDTGSWHNIWEIIRVDVSSDLVTVDAIFFGGSQHGRTRARYVTSYRIGEREITELRSDQRVLERSSKSIFEGK